MRRTALISLVMGLFAFTAANAQTVSIYGTASPTYLNHLYTLSSATNPQATLAGNWFVGFNGGVTFNFTGSGPITLGLDFRGGPEIGTPGLGSALAGLKVGFPSPALRLKPYGQFSIGYLEQRHQTGTGSALVKDAESYFAVELLGGVDYPVASHVDIRVLELGIGTSYVLVNNGINTRAKVGIFSVNSGVVFHF